MMRVLLLWCPSVAGLQAYMTGHRAFVYAPVLANMHYILPGTEAL